MSDQEFAYDDDEIEVDDKKLKVDPLHHKAKMEKLTKMWNKLDRPYNTAQEMEQALIVIGSRGEIFIWDENAEKYEFWNNKDDLWASIRAFCPVIHRGTRWPTKSNIYVRQNFCFSAKKIDFHMTSYDSRLDPHEHTAWISCLHKTKMRPRYSEDVQGWLLAFGGRRSDKLLDWLASFSRLDRSTCMLYICGPKGIGKNLLAESLAQIWGGFADWEDRASDYQSDMGRNPFIWANEDMEKPRRTSIMSAIRRVIAGGNQRINEKQRPAYGMQCYYRLLVTANNAKLLRSWANLSTDDVEAVKERVGYFYASANAKTFLEKLAASQGCKVSDITTRFAQGELAQHVLWLAENRELENDGNQRLLVEGWASDVTEMLEYETQEAHQFAHYFNAVRYNRAGSMRSIKIDGDSFWINYTNLLQEWDGNSYKKTDQVRWKEMRDFIKLITTNDKKRMRPGGTDNPVYYYKIDNSKLKSLLINYGFDAEDAADMIIADDTDTVMVEVSSHDQRNEIENLVHSMEDSLDKTVMLTCMEVFPEANYSSLLDIKENITSHLTEELDSDTIGKLKIGSRIVASLKQEYDAQNWKAVTQLFKEVHYEQVGFNQQGSLHRKQGSSDRMRQFGIGPDF